MRESVLAVLLAWTLAVQRGRCGSLEKVALRSNNVLEDFSAYRHISIIHFEVPERIVAAVFKFTAKEEKTGGIGKCSPRNISLYLKCGSLPFVRPDGSKVAAKLLEMENRRHYRSLDMRSDGDEYTIKMVAPPAGDWYTIAFRSWIDPDKEKIRQQGLSVSCETLLDAEMFLEMPTKTSLVADPEAEHKVQLDVASDTAIVQYFLPDVGMADLSLYLNSSCGEDCKIDVHVTAGDTLVSGLLNSTVWVRTFKPHSGGFHYVTLRLLSENASNVTMRLSTNREQFDQTDDKVTVVKLSKKSFPDFFLFDYEHLRGNDTKPQAFNVTAEALSVLKFEIGRVYDVGGTVTLGFKLVDVEEKNKKTIVLAACVSLGYYANIMAAANGSNANLVRCVRENMITTADIYTNATEPAYVHIPFPEAGTWYVSLRVFCPNVASNNNTGVNTSSTCFCDNICLQGNATCDKCNCLPRCPLARVESIVSSSPCIEGRCGRRGKCMHYMSGSFVYSACHCTGGYRGFDCADATYVLSSSRILLQLLALTLSNCAFCGSIYVAIRREYFTEAIAYAAVMFFSTFYHACEAGEDVYSVCIMRLSVLQFCDFFNALLAIWVTLVAMASFGPRITAFCQMAGAIVLAMGAEMDRTALWVFLLPAVTGSALIGVSWGLRCRTKRTVRYPSRPYRIIYFPAGFLLVTLGLICYAFLQTRRNYYLVHSFWHICVAIGVILLLPKRQYMK